MALRARVPAESCRGGAAEVSLRSRIGAYRLHARHDQRETTKKARFLERFEREVPAARVT